MSTLPILAEQYEGYHIAVWPQIDQVSPYYANATVERGGRIAGFGGLSAATPELAMERAKRLIDEQDFGDGGRVQEESKELTRQTADKFPVLPAGTNSGA